MNKVFGSHVLITGASRGIGAASADLFASKGFHVYAVSRHCEEKTVDYDGGGSITYIPADVTDINSLRNAFSHIDALEIVIHCAGFGISGSAECTSSEAAHMQMETNYFGVLNVNSLALPLLRKNKRSLVIITSSVAGVIPIPFQSHYSSSKYALEAYGEALRMEGRLFGIKVCLVEPGDTRTGFTSARKYNEPVDSPYYSRCISAVEKMANDERNGKDPITVARVFLAQTGKKNPPVRVAVGISYKILALLGRILPSKLKQFILCKLY